MFSIAAMILSGGYFSKKISEKSLNIKIPHLKSVRLKKNALNILVSASIFLFIFFLFIDSIP